jgi:hypothetical protein
VYSVGSQIIVPCKSVIDLGVAIDPNLKPSSHCANIVYKASARAKLILKAFLSHDCRSLTRAFIILNRVLPAWNHLPDICFDCDTVSAFKTRLSNINLSLYLKGKM